MSVVRLLRVIASGAAIGLATLAVMEVGLRVFAPEAGPHTWVVGDAEYGQFNRKNFHGRYSFPWGFAMEVRTNSLGLRDYEVPALEEGQRTILFVGDSFTFGHGVSVAERFDRVLSEKLKEAGHSFRCINAGVNGWGTLQELHYAEAQLETFRPDVIVLTFCGNDPYNDDYFLTRARPFETAPAAWRDFLNRHSHLYRFMLRRYFVYLNNRHIKQAMRHSSAVLDEQSGSVLTPADFARTAEAIRAFALKFREFNADGLLFVQATAPWNEGIREQLSALDEEEGVRYVDMYDAVQGMMPEALQLPGDKHWNARMHRLVAEQLFAAVEAYDVGKEAGS